MCCLSVGKRPHEKYASLKMGALPLMHVALERYYTKFCLEIKNIECLRNRAFAVHEP